MIALGAALLLAFWQGQTPDSFPHVAHRGLFTTCNACHRGIVTGDSATARPTVASCADCHDGDIARRVNWTPALVRVTTLRFDHRSHAARLAERRDSADCRACHAVNGGGTFMAVGRAAPERCLSCHAHRAPTHLAAADCNQCHRPLHQVTRLAALDITRFPRPASHDSTYAFTHAREASSLTCSTCHTRETCASCHVNASQVAEIRALGTNAATPRARRTVWPTPPSHRAPAFIRRHGALARDRAATCANCHARESCLTCHRVEERVPAVAQVTRRTRGTAPGVELADRRPPDHVPGFEVRHRAAGAGGDATCARCHTTAYCAACHDAGATPAFHGANFVERHAGASFTSELECTSCHQTETFCRSCHVRTGRAETGATMGRYHDAQPLWVFGHGGSARRAIESCASCHEQRDCLQCHSASRGWGVNPHGRGFDGDLERRNPAMCRLCHASGPPRR